MEIVLRCEISYFVRKLQYQSIIICILNNANTNNSYIILKILIIKNSQQDIRFYVILQRFITFKLPVNNNTNNFTNFDFIIRLNFNICH